VSKLGGLFDIFRTPGRELTAEEREEIEGTSETVMERLERVRRESDIVGQLELEAWVSAAMPAMLDEIEEQIRSRQGGIAEFQRLASNVEESIKMEAPAGGADALHKRLKEAGVPMRRGSGTYRLWYIEIGKIGAQDE
jgi:hypothetical protein